MCTARCPQAAGRAIQLGNGQAFVVNDVKLTGAGGTGAVTGGAGVHAKVAGGYEDTFVESGTFTVRGIDFQSGSPAGNTGVAADGSSYNTPGNAKRAASVNIVVENCTFDNQFYFYTNDGDTKAQNLTIRGCTFRGSAQTANMPFLFSRTRRSGAKTLPLCWKTTSSRTMTEASTCRRAAARWWKFGKTP